MLRRSNKYIDETTPWALAKDENEKNKLETVIYNLLESIRVSAVELEPFMPETSENILKQLNTSNKATTYQGDNSYATTTPVPLFQRIDKVKKLEEIENSLK